MERKAKAKEYLIRSHKKNWPEKSFVPTIISGLPRFYHKKAKSRPVQIFQGWREHLLCIRTTTRSFTVQTGFLLLFFIFDPIAVGLQTFKKCVQSFIFIIQDIVPELYVRCNPPPICPTLHKKFPAGLRIPNNTFFSSVFIVGPTPPPPSPIYLILYFSIKHSSSNFFSKPSSCWLVSAVQG